MARKRGTHAAWTGMLMACWLFGGTTIVGCGIKGPPVPLWQRPVPRVVDLAAVVGERWVDLTWSLSEPLGSTPAESIRRVRSGADPLHRVDPRRGY